MKPTKNISVPRRVSFSSGTEFSSREKISEIPQTLANKPRSSSAPQLLVRLPGTWKNEWKSQTNSDEPSSSASDSHQKNLAQSKNTGKENFIFSMPDALFSNDVKDESKPKLSEFISSSSIRNKYESVNNISHHPQQDQTSQSPRSRGVSVSSLRRLSSKYSNSSSTRSSPDSLTPRSPDSSQSSPSPTTKSSRNPLKRSLAEIQEAIIVTMKDFSSLSNSSSGTSRDHEKIILLNIFTKSELRNFAKKIHSLKKSNQFMANPATSQRTLIKAKLIENLNPESDFHDPQKLEILIDGLRSYIAYEESEIDKIIDLNDEQFKKFINEAAEAAFLKPWEKDHSDVDHELKKYLDAVKPTFARDFQHSDYFIKKKNEPLQKILSIEEFLEFFNSQEATNLSMLVSNIASQNLGNFLKNALFLRHNSAGISASVLTTNEGLPLMPLAKVKATYVFEKSEDGSVDISYDWTSSQEINGTKEIRAREMTEAGNSFLVQDALLQIQVKIHIDKDRTWSIGHPHVMAKGWIKEQI